MIFDKLENKDELYDWILTYGGFYEAKFSAPTVSLEYLMRFWNGNKEKLYHLLDDHIILEKEIEYDRSQDELVEEMSRACRGDGNSFRREYKNWVNKWFYDMLDTYPEEDFYYKRCSLYEMVSFESLVSNVYYGESFKININDNIISIQNGAKITKILGKIAKAANLEGYENFRLAHSRGLNLKKLKGTLCFSIHPLDFFTMSDNEYDWDSCMNWRNQGCYRMGTVEMCNSPYVVVCYLKGDKEMRFFNNVWNSKKWRNLFIVSPNIITGIKGYPYQSEKLDILCIETLKALAEKNFGWEYESTIRKHHFEYNEEEMTFPEDDRTCTLCFDTAFMYNDFGNENTTHFILNPKASSVSIFYSGETECMCCGEELDCDDVEDAKDVICDNCLTRTYCEECGATISPEDCYELDGLLLCENCYYENRVIDPITDEEHHANNTIQIYLVNSEDELQQDYEEFSQKHSYIVCYDDAHEFKGFFSYPHYGLLKSSYWWGKNIRYVLRNECTKDGLDVFRVCGSPTFQLNFYKKNYIIYM